MIKRLPRKLVGCEVVLFPVMLGGDTMRLRSLFVHLRGYQMGITWHIRPLPNQRTPPVPIGESFGQ